mgnify:FL=1
MGLDRTKVQTVGMMGGKVDAGSIAFVTSATTIAVPTTLSYIYAGVGITTTTPFGASCPVGKVTAGSVTFTRASGGTSADVLNYILFGY